MESDDCDRRFAGEGGEALQLDDDYYSEEDFEEEEKEDLPPQRKPQTSHSVPSKPIQQLLPQQKGNPVALPAGQGEVMRQNVENQPFYLGVKVNESQEID